MKENNTHQSLDIEELLLSKTWKELSSEERTFALTQVENEQEYSELKATLLSIKQISSSTENVLIPNRIKEELIQKMEAKRSFFGVIASFLFPKDVPLLRKPGLQLASLAMLLLLVINIGLDFTKNKKGEMAVNTIKQKEQLNLIPELEKKEEGFYDLEINNQETTREKKQTEKPLAPQEEMVKEIVGNKPNSGSKKMAEADNYIAEDEEIVLIPDNRLDWKEAASARKPEKIVVRDSVPIQSYKDVSLDQIAVTQYTNNESNVISLDAIQSESSSVKLAKKKSSSNSKSLKDNEELIGMLFVAM